MAAKILEEIVAHTKQRVAEDKQKCSLEEMKAKATALPQGEFSFYNTLRNNKKNHAISFISEVKKASPSKGVISPHFPYLEIAQSYEDIGCDCLSVLTEPKWFLGGDEIFQEIRQVSSLPMLRKDFTIDAYQIYQAKVLGADCVLLICAILDKETIREYLDICQSLGLSALVETHDETELDCAVEAGGKLIGVNNRNLHDFSVNLHNAPHLREKLSPSLAEDVIFVAESGILTPEDGILMGKQGADALLIGEALMKAKDRKAFVEGIRQGLQASMLST